MAKYLLKVVFLVLVQTVCLTSYAFAEVVKVGVLLPLTGKLRPFGEIEQRSFLMAVKEINEKGGIHGKAVDLIIEDTQGDPNTGRWAIKKLISKDKVILVGGGWSSSVTWAAAPVAQESKIPFLINTASADKITEQGWDYIFRLNPPTSEYERGFESFCREVAQDTKTAVVIYEKSSFGQAGKDKFVKLIDRLKLKMILQRGYEADALDFAPTLMQIKSRKPDLIAMVSETRSASQIMKEAKALNLKPRLYFGVSSNFAHLRFGKSLGRRAEYLFSSTLWTPSVPYPGARVYHEKFMGAFGMSPGYHGAQAYAAMQVIADALKRSESLKAEDIRDAFSQTDTMTVFGPVRFVSYGKKRQQNRHQTLLVQWLKGRLETVWPETLASSDFAYPLPR